MDRNALHHLAALNQDMEKALEVLGKLTEYPELQDEGFIIKRAYFQEHLAFVNVYVLHRLEESEQKILRSSFTERDAHERKLRDPDDCYFEVLRREEERRDLGLPPMIGVLRGMRRATGQEIFSGLFANSRDQEGAEDKGVDGTKERL